MMASTTTSGHLREFNPEIDNWTIFQARLQNYFAANEITEAKKKRAILLNCLNESAYKLVYNLCIPNKPEENSYEDLVKILNTHLAPHKSIFSNRYKFYQAEKNKNESVNEWLARVRNLAADCEFGTELKVMLRDKFITGFERGRILDRLLEESKDITLDKAVEIAISRDATNQFNFQPSGSGIKQEPSSTSLHHMRTNRHQTKNSTTPQQHGNGQNESRKCKCCGKYNHSKDKCFFRNSLCYKCNTSGHIAPVCTNTNRYVKSKKNLPKINLLETENNLFLLNNKKNIEPITIDLLIENKLINCQIDTGANISAISNECYKNQFSHIKLLPNNKIINLYNGTKIKPDGQITVDIKYKNKLNKLELVVIKNGGPPILGRNFLYLFNLGIAELKYVNVEKDIDIKNLTSKFSSLFEPGMGKFNKGVINLKLKNKDVTPKFCRPRSLPFILKQKVEMELDRLLKSQIIRAVSFSKWATPIVPVIKKDGSVRICGDYKITINPHLEMEHYPLPKTDELINQLQGGKYFSKIDLANAYQQVELDEPSKELLTIATHKGLFQYNRLAFGVNTAPTKFQRIVEAVLQGVPGTVCFLDDICVTGKTKSEHLENLSMVFQRLADCGFKLNVGKCEFFKDSVNYLGFIIDKEGVHTCPDKLKAIEKVPRPNNVTQLKSFLGLINYYGKFVRNLAAILTPLYNLLKKNITWRWTSECEHAFGLVKEKLLSAEVLTHFNPTIPLKLTVDASEYGIGAILSHIYPSNVERPLAYASRTLSNRERNYAQVEKEGLAVIFGICKFHQYLYGIKFKLVTDNKALVSIFNPKKGIPEHSANRLRRWAVILSNYSYEIEFVKSEHNAADSLSRLPLKVDHSEIWEDVDVNYCNFLKNDQIPLNFDSIKQSTATDVELKEIINYVRKGWPTQNNVSTNLKAYYRIREELSIEDDCVFWNNRVVIPKVIREPILNSLHSSHLGINKMKEMARSFFWWPELNKNIEQLTKSCDACIANFKSPPKSKLTAWNWPESVFERIHIDYMEFENKYFLVIVDAHTKWVEVFPSSTMNTKFTIEKLRETFARYGLPLTLVSDNARQFEAYEFKTFLSNNGITHVTSPPYHPQSNGAAENSVKNVKNALKKSLFRKSSKDINLNLNKFLFDYRNSVHSTTGTTPTQLMFGRTLRNRFSQLLPNKTIKQNVIKAQNRQTKYFGGHRKVQFVEGEVALARDYKNTMKPTWIRGKIVKCLSKSTLLIKIPELNNVIWKRHVNQLLKYNVSNVVPAMVETNEPNKSTKENPIVLKDNPVANVNNNCNKNVETVINEELLRSKPKRIIKAPERFGFD